MSGNLDWRWIGIGVAIMFGLNIVASLIIAALIGGEMPETATSPRRLRLPSAAGACCWGP
jgi:hypothetical protein